MAFDQFRGDAVIMHTARHAAVRVFLAINAIMGQHWKALNFTEQKPCVFYKLRYNIHIKLLEDEYGI